jgi:hypothetical protein
MLKIINYLLKRKFIIFLFLLLVLGIYLFFQLLKKEDTQPPISTVRQTVLNWRSVEPGTTTREQIVNEFGEPAKTVHNEDELIFYYDSNHPNFDDQIYFDQDDNKVDLVKEVIPWDEKRKSEDIIKEYGKTTEIFFAEGENEFSAPIYLLYVYPADGIAYVGHKDLGTLLEIWYFEPTTSEDFVNKYIPDYTKVE